MIDGQVQQGDILITPLASTDLRVKRGAKVDAQAGCLVLARGTATGNAHTVPADDADLYECDPPDPFVRIMQVNRDTVISHGGASVDHDALPVTAGEKVVLRQGWRQIVED